MSFPQQWDPPGGGGGLGQPPGGGGPPPGGEAPLERIPFSPADERNISQTALFMKVAGVLAVLSALVSLTGSVAVGFYWSTPSPANVCAGLIALVVQAALAAVLFMSSSAFEKIVSSDGADQVHLMHGMRRLRTYFLTKAILYTLGMTIGCLCAALAAAFGVAGLAILAGSH